MGGRGAVVLLCEGEDGEGVVGRDCGLVFDDGSAGVGVIMHGGRWV